MTAALHSSPAPLVGVVMGSDSDWRVMSDASQALTDFGVPHEVEVVSAHRTPDKLVAYGREARGRGIRVIIAGAGGAAHLPGMLASVTALPVIGVPVPLATLDGLDSLLSIVQMPAGIPVGTLAIVGLWMWSVSPVPEIPLRRRESHCAHLLLLPLLLSR